MAARRIGLVLGLVAAVTVAGCGNQSRNSADGGSMAGMDMGGTTTSARAMLVPSNSVSGGGVATVAAVKGQLHVDVRAQHLAAGARFVVHLHRGSCAAIGDVIQTVGDIQTDQAGGGGAHLEYPAGDVPMPSFVDVHAAEGTEGPVLCGDLRKT